MTLIGSHDRQPFVRGDRPPLAEPTCEVHILQPLERRGACKRCSTGPPRRPITELKAREIEVQEAGRARSDIFGRRRPRAGSRSSTLLARAPTEGKLTITDQYVTDCLQQNIALYDKNGEQHYDVISAFIKSVRGSDPNAAIDYLAPHAGRGRGARASSHRRLVILASEDIGLANPNALLLANACFDTVHKIGMPEARITLAETTIYLATSPQERLAYHGHRPGAVGCVERDTTSNRPVPLHLRNAPTKLMDQGGVRQRV